MRDRPSDQHRRVAEQVTGRKLTPDEIVHHRDEDKSNNAQTNLEVEPRGDHTTRHNKTRGLGRLRKALRLTQGREEKLY